MQTGMDMSRGSARGPSPVARRPVRRGRRPAATRALWVGTTVATILLLMAAAVVTDATVYYGKIHAGVSVAGIDLGGRTRAEATSLLAEVVDHARSAQLTVSAGDRTWTLSAEDAGAVADIDAAVDAAMAVTREHGTFTDIGTSWKLFFSRRDLPLGGTVDEASVTSFVAGIAAKLDVPPVNAGLAIKDGRIEPIESAAGTAVDQPALVAGLTARFRELRTDAMTVPLVTTEPDVTAEDNAEARAQAETMISGPVAVHGGGKTWTLTAREIASSLGFSSKDSGGVATLVPFVDARKLQRLLDQIADEVREKAKDATFAHSASRAWVVPGKNGRQLDAAATARAITTAALEQTGREAQVATKDLEPGLTTAQAKAMGISEKLSWYSTKYICPADRQINVKLAVKYGTNVFLAPGDEYDFDKQIGPRTPGRGWHKAKGIIGPNQLEDVLGGGICQVSTTLFNAVADKKAGLKILERQYHSLFISHYPLGRDATVTDGGKNLRFVNDMDHYVWITGESNGVTTTITVWGTDQGRSTRWTIGKYYDVVAMTKTTVTDPELKKGKTSLLKQGQEGKSLKTTRVVSEGGKAIHKNVWTNRWMMYPEKVAVGTATTSTTHPPSTARTTTTAPPASTSSTASAASPAS